MQFPARSSLPVSDQQLLAFPQDAEKLEQSFRKLFLIRWQNIGGTNQWLNHVMEIFAAFMVCGVFTTLLIPETKRSSLEELAKVYHGDNESSEINSTEIADLFAIYL
jgi:hypothetical protein